MRFNPGDIVIRKDINGRKRWVFRYYGADGLNAYCVPETMRFSSNVVCFLPGMLKKVA